jgi:hypothetical protein
MSLAALEEGRDSKPKIRSILCHPHTHTHTLGFLMENSDSQRDSILLSLSVGFLLKQTRIPSGSYKQTVRDGRASQHYLKVISMSKFNRGLFKVKRKHVHLDHPSFRE